MVQFFKSLGLALLFSVGVGSVGKAASFDCNKATTETEIAICGDPQLSKLDEVLAELYQIKKSINYSSAQLSEVSDQLKKYNPLYDNFPAFTRDQTKANQLAWVKNEQANCLANNKCLVVAYNKRILDFFDFSGDQQTQKWRILEKLDPIDSKFSIIIWSFNNNVSGKVDGCFDRNCRGVYYLVSIHSKVSGNIIDVTPTLILPKDNDRLQYEMGIFPSVGDEISISLSSWMSSGSWGSSTNTYNFKISDEAVRLKSYQHFEYSRNIHLFKTTILDFENNRISIEIENGSDDNQEVFDQILEPDESLVIRKSFDTIPPLNFKQVDPDTMYDVMEKIKEQSLP